MCSHNHPQQCDNDKASWRKKSQLSCSDKWYPPGRYNETAQARSVFDDEEHVCAFAISLLLYFT